MILVVTSACVVAACGGGSDDSVRTGVRDGSSTTTTVTVPSPTTPGSSAVGPTERPTIDGASVVGWTRSGGSATGTITVHESAAAPGTDHGALGEVPDDQTYTVAYDFAAQRSRLRFTLPNLDDIDLGLGTDPPSSTTAPTEPPDGTKVEVRSVDGMQYVKDGSWLCPLCGIDPGDPVYPHDKWIKVPYEGDDPTFSLEGTFSLSGNLGWLALLGAPVRWSGSAEAPDGDHVDLYRASLAADEVRAKLPKDAAGSELGAIQGKTVQIEVGIDEQGHLRRLDLGYRSDDRQVTWKARLDHYGTPVAIEVPPKADVWTGG